MPIDPLLPELVISTLGLRRFLGPKAIPPLTKGQREAIGSARGTVRQLLQRFMVRAEFAPAAALADFDFHRTIDLLTAPETQTRMEGNLAAFEDADLALGIAETVGRMSNYLRDRLPRSTRDTWTGPQPVKPSDMELAKFRRTWEVANDPLIALRDLNEGCLSRDQVRALEDLYPALYAMIRELALEVLIELKARRGEGWALPMAKDRQLATLLQAKTFDARLGAEIQGLYQKGEPEAPRRGRLKLNVESEQTPAQRLGTARP